MGREWKKFNQSISIEHLATTHDMTWHIMIYHDISWHFITFHDISWLMMTWHDMIFFHTNQKHHFCRNTSQLRHFVTKITDYAFFDSFWGSHGIINNNASCTTLVQSNIFCTQKLPLLVNSGAENGSSGAWIKNGNYFLSPSFPKFGGYDTFLMWISVLGYLLAKKTSHFRLNLSNFSFTKSQNQNIYWPGSIFFSNRSSPAPNMCNKLLLAPSEFSFGHCLNEGGGSTHAF